MRLLVIALFGLTACSQTPIVDLRASGDTAQFYQRDLNECKTLIKQSRSVWHKPLLGTDPMLVQCLNGRGHSILANK